MSGNLVKEHAFDSVTVQPFTDRCLMLTGRLSRPGKHCRGASSHLVLGFTVQRL